MLIPTSRLYVFPIMYTLAVYRLSVRTKLIIIIRIILSLLVIYKLVPLIMRPLVPPNSIVSFLIVFYLKKIVAMKEQSRLSSKFASTNIAT